MSFHRMLGNAGVICACLGFGCGGDDGEGPTAPAGGEPRGSPAGSGGMPGGGGTPTGGGTTTSSGDEGDNPDALGEADCVAPPNATVEWLGEQVFGVSCRVTCATGRADCDGSRENGCETDVSDAAACGRCIDGCLTDVCGEAAVCTSQEAEVWSLRAAVGDGGVRDLAVHANGQIFARVNAAVIEAEAEPLAALTPGALLMVGQEGVVWQSLPGDPRTSSEQSSTLTTDTRVVAAGAGFYVAEYFGSAEIAGQRFNAPPTLGGGRGRDVMLSLISARGERIWSRQLNLPGSPSVFGLFADEASNAFVHIYIDEDFTYEGQAVDVSSSGSYVLFAFGSAGDFLWVDTISSPLTARAASGGFFATSGIVGGEMRSATTGEPVRDMPPLAAGANMFSMRSDGSLIVAGTAPSADLEHHGGLPGLTGVSALAGEAPRHQRAIFVQKLDAAGALVWESHFAGLLDVSLYDFAIAADGTVYVLASGAVGDLFANEPVRLFVARVGPDGHQQGAFRFDAEETRGAAMALGEDGTLHVGAHFAGGAVLDEAISGSGLVGIGLQFTPL